MLPDPMQQFNDLPRTDRTAMQSHEHLLDLSQGQPHDRA